MTLPAQLVLECQTLTLLHSSVRLFLGLLKYIILSLQSNLKGLPIKNEITCPPRPKKKKQQPQAQKKS